VLPSRGNFVLATTPGAAPARPLYDALKVRGVLVRFFDKPGLNDRLRITVGTTQENGAMLAALDAALG
jgi:histidinol-phosphate aminotransferase